MEWSRHVFGEFLDALPDAAFVVEDGERIVLSNSRAAELFRLPPGGLYHKKLDSLLAPESGSPRERHPYFPDPPIHLRTGQDWMFIRSDGQPFAADVRYGRIMLDGQFLVLAVVRDVSERKLAEDELSKSEERLRQAVRVSEIGIFDHDHATDTHFWTTRQYEMYGWPTSERVTVPAFLQRLHPDDREAIGAGIRRAHDPAGDGSFDVEHRIIRSDGQVRWIATRSTTLFAGEGAARHAVRTVGASLDFTDRKNAEEARERLATILDATPDFVSIADPAGNLLYLNQAARTLLGLGPDDDLSTYRVADHRLERTRELMVGTAIPAAIRDGLWRGETALLDREGREIPVSQVCLAHRRSDGTIDFLSTIARDLTKEKSLEAQILHAQKMEAIGRLAGGVAHDFNNLLSVILGSATLAANGLPIGHSSRGDIEEVQRAAERAAELTRGMLAFSRKQVLRPRVLDVNEVLERLMPMMQRLIGEHIELRVKLAVDLGRIKVDANHLEQVIMNLVVNARDAMSTGGTLTVETQNTVFDERQASPRAELGTGPFVMISVSDTGVGMAPATKARIFEPFFTTKGPGQGTGLGLSIVFRIVKQSGGEISVKSELGRGACFTLFFPRTDEVESIESRKLRLPSSVVANRAVILLVEDEPQLRKLMATVLGRSGYEVLVAAGPLEALAIAQRETRFIDLLLSDVVMPQMSGKDLAERLTAARPDLLVLLTSGYIESGVVDAKIPGKGAYFLPKPFTPETLLAKVHLVLEEGRIASAE